MASLLIFLDKAEAAADDLPGGEDGDIPPAGED
jgi:hypothetical protein